MKTLQKISPSKKSYLGHSAVGTVCGREEHHFVLLHEIPKFVGRRADCLFKFVLAHPLQLRGIVVVIVIILLRGIVVIVTIILLRGITARAHTRAHILLCKIDLKWKSSLS
jgi:hypothetical protein